MTTTISPDRTDRRASPERPEAYEEFTPRVAPWWVPWLVAVAVFALVVGVGSYLVYGRGYFVPSMMGRGHVPPVTGYYQGDEVRFIHTEASDLNVAARLTGMMRSQVVTVPELGQLPPSALGKVFVFTNGIRRESPPRGPFGFQPDVFDSVPGDPGYTPLRAVNIVSWKKGVTPRLLRSADQVRQAEVAGEVTITEPGVVVNMPILRWPTGSR